MIHLGLNRLTYIVKFDASCYYPITFEKPNTKILFGMSFGLFSSNSISVAWRASDRLEQIDLFAYINMNGVNSLHYIGAIETNKAYAIKIKREKKYNLSWIRIFDAETGQNHISFSTHFKCPIIKIGYTVARKYNHKILLERS